jgi:hypothetical protein
MDKKKALLAGRLPTDSVPIPGVGEVWLRGLSRGEVLEYRSREGTSVKEDEQYLLSLCMVDPELTEDEVGQWQVGATHDEFNNVVDTMRFLSGLMDDAAKAAYKSVRDESGS